MAAGVDIRRVTVFGGSGFLGGEIVGRLSAEGIEARIAVRHPERVRLDGRSGTATPVYADVRDETSVALAIEGSDAVVNAVGLYVERGAATFEAVHELGARNVAHQCAELNVRRLVHISGIGADIHSPSLYVRARAKGELLVGDVFPKATTLRPSVLFGPDGDFLSALAEVARRAPVLPLFGRGQTRLQPVNVNDVAAAVLRAVRSPGAEGNIYELGGPDTYSYRALLELVLAQTRRRRLLLPVPFWVWELLAVVLSPLPSPPLTRAQVVLMSQDNVVGETALSFADLGITPTALEEILPRYRF